jgi:hypothetical protein
MTESVTIENVAQVRRIISKLAPEVKKALDKANREAAAPLLGIARSNFVDSPMANWGKWTDKRGRDLSYDVAAVRKGIKIKAGKRSRTSPWSALTQIQNTTAAGAIYEMAGRKTNNTQFTRNLQGLFPVSVNGLSRGIWKAIKEYPIRKYQNAVIKNYEDAVKVTQAELDRLTNNG